MLPGFRILFAITCLSVSVLIFGLGAAAFLRSAHENIASARWQPIETPERVDLAPPTLAMLRVEPEPTLPAPAPIELPAAATVPLGDEAAAERPAAEPAAPSPPHTGQAEQRAPAEPVATSATPAPQPADELPIAAPPLPQEAAQDAPVVPAAAEPKMAAPTTEDTAAVETNEPPSAAPTVAALSENQAVPLENADALVPDTAAATPVVPTRDATAETSASAASARPAVAGADTLKDDDKAIEAAPSAKIAALAEPALANVAPLPQKEVRIPVPRIDPAEIEAQRQRALAQQRSRTRALQARRIAAARARAAAQAAAAANYPFGVPATTSASSR